MGLNAKRYVLIALAVILAVAGVVAIAFAVMSPAHIYFSVTNAGYDDGDLDSTGGDLKLTFTLAADNTSPRAAVRYESMFVDVSNSTQWESWIKADIKLSSTPLQQKTRSVEHIVGSVPLVGALVDAFTGNMTTKSFAVMVTAAARFKVGIACTRLYDIKVSCVPVDFLSPAGLSQPVPCYPA